MAQPLTGDLLVEAHRSFACDAAPLFEHLDGINLQPFDAEDDSVTFECATFLLPKAHNPKSRMLGPLTG